MLHARENIIICPDSHNNLKNYSIELGKKLYNNVTVIERKQIGSIWKNDCNAKNTKWNAKLCYVYINLWLDPIRNIALSFGHQILGIFIGK